jgi:hypothetical protein
MQEIANHAGIKVSGQRLPAFRPPIKPIRMGMLIGEDEGDE